MLTVIIALLVIGVLIFVHELGHFIAAKLMGVKVEVFSLGFGPKILGFKKGETEYRVSAFPLGGYVKLYGEHPETLPSVVEKDKAFAFKKTWQKAFIVVSGPLANFILPVLLFWFLFWVSGSYLLSTKIGEVLPDSPAEKAGLAPGDEIIEVNGKRVKSFDELVLYLKSKETVNEVLLKIKRGSQVLEVKLVPETKEGYNVFGKKTHVPFIGVKSTQEIVHQKHGFIEAFKLAIEKVIDITTLTFIALFKLFTGDLPFSTLGGPITIGKMAGDTAKLGFYPLLSFTALLSVNLGIINLLPLPMLDGGHLVIFSIEAIRRKPLSLKTQELIFKIGFFIIIALSIAVFYNDILKLLSGWKLP
ncbi:RIP metalloprotease RseP [Thermodesulfobacterium sp. TA1]|uniref:RIP metalloprotease RseP n=1 Tax=Thermodesulfobacterium sp. TA1 TaxID=2234087 RepID=UPI001231DCCF|nr:RIP metalloprotease RseP [Thermodesulfobacterium sp. TA1]QER41524.1 RIP metalloprotease RseP [Thermodesulfobacterium sp. TA1]